MPLTPAPLPSLLGLCLCLCLLLGGVAGTDVGTTQPQGESLNGEPRRFKLPPHLLNRNLQIITKNGDLYFDLARVNETRLQISKNQSVLGITATSRECPVQFLVLGMNANYILDEDLFTYCPIKNLTLKGKRWCHKEGKLLQRQGLLDVSVTNATCQDAWQQLKNGTHAVPYTMKEGVQKLQEFGITSCLMEKCDCRWYFNNDSYFVNMDCEGRGLTDEGLAKMHMMQDNVNNVIFTRNNLSSMETVIEYLKPNHEKIKMVTLDDNQMTELPRLGGLFPRIIDVSLVNNSIVKIDLKEFVALMVRKDLRLILTGNPFPCDDTMTALKSIIFEQCTQFCDQYLKEVTCRRQSDGEPVPLYKLAEAGYAKPVNWLTVVNVILGLLNVVMIALIVDLVLVLAKRGRRAGRRPMMDYAVCLLRDLLCCLCRGGRGRSNKRD